MTSVMFKQLIKTLIILISYIFYMDFFNLIFSFFGSKNIIFNMFIADLCFFLAMIFIYYKKIKKDLLGFINNYNIKDKILVVLKYVILAFIINIVLGIVTELLFPGMSVDENTNVIWDLFSISTLYTTFKTLIFAPIAEELFFKQTIRDIIPNNKLFIIASGFIYSIVNVAFSEISLFTLASIIPFFIFSTILSFAYIKNNDNIFIVMLIKFVYQLIPFTILCLGV